MADGFKKLSTEELANTAGGVQGKVGLYEGPMMTVTGLESGWLAIRTDPKYDASNEIGQLFNGDTVQVIGNGAVCEHDFDKNAGTNYIWVYSSRLNVSGWVNSRFLR